jgi:hypothetical protein
MLRSQRIFDEAKFTSERTARVIVLKLHVGRTESISVNNIAHWAEGIYSSTIICRAQRVEYASGLLDRIQILEGAILQSL